jgi:ABC-2 type transport system permease protein
MGDEGSADASRRFREKLKQRSDFTERASWLLPSVAAQLQFNEIAETNLESHLRYLDSVRNYHEVVRKNFYPYIFRNTKISEVDFGKTPRHFFKNESRTNTFSSEFFAILTASFLFIGLGWLNLQKRILNFQEVL